MRKIKNIKIFLGLIALAMVLTIGFNASTVYATSEEVVVVQETLIDAIENAESGETIKLSSNVALSNPLEISKSITLDGNGYKLTSTAARAINVSGAENVTIKNLEIEASGERGINVIQNAKNVTIDNVTINASNYAVNVAASAPNATITITNESNLTGLNTVNVAAENTTVTITDSKITCNDQNTNENYGALTLNPTAKGSTITVTNTEIVVEGDSLVASKGCEDGEIFIDGSATGIEVVAYIKYGDYAYTFTSLEDAIKAAKDGETITLIRDVALSEKIDIDVNITLDLNSHKITTNAKNAFYVYKDLTVKNGTIENTNIVGRCLNTRSDLNLRLEEVNLVATSNNNTQPLTLGVSANETNVTIVNSTINAGNSGYAIISFVKANILIEKSELSGYGVLYMKDGSKSTTVNVKSSTLNSTNIYTQDTNEFGVVVVEDENISLNVDIDSHINVTTTGTQNHYVFIVNVAAKPKLFVARSVATDNSLVADVQGTIKLTGDSARIFDLNQSDAAITIANNAENKLALEKEGIVAIETSEGLLVSWDAYVDKYIEEFEKAFDSLDKNIYDSKGLAELDDIKQQFIESIKNVEPFEYEEVETLFDSNIKGLDNVMTGAENALASAKETALAEVEKTYYVDKDQYKASINSATTPTEVETLVDRMKTEEAQLLGADRADSVEAIKAAVTGYEIDTTQYEANVNAASTPEAIAAAESAALKEITELKAAIDALASAKETALAEVEKTYYVNKDQYKASINSATTPTEVETLVGTMKTEEAQLLGADRADSVEAIKAAVTGYEIDTTQYEANINAASTPEAIAAAESAALKEITELKAEFEKTEDLRLICIIMLSVVALGAVIALVILYIKHKNNKNKEQVKVPFIDNTNTSTLNNIERKPYKPFVDRIAEANELTQEFYSTIKNELLSYEKIKSRISKRGESFSIGNAVQAKLRMTGKTLKLFLALDPNEFDKNIYHHEDVSDKKAFEHTPLLIRLRSRRAVKYAITLIAMLMEKSNVAKKPLDETKVVENLGEVMDEVSVDVDDTNIKSFPTIERKPFKPYANRIMEASELTQEFYSTIKNELLSYRKMKSRISKRGESFRIGRTLQAKLVLTGKTMKLFLALDPNEFDQNIYFHKDASDKKAYEQTPLLIRLRSRRAVKHALALITKMMENNNVLKKSKHEVKDYIKELGNIIE